MISTKWIGPEEQTCRELQTQFACHEDKKEPIRELGDLERVLFVCHESRLQMKLIALKTSLARQEISIVSLEVTHTCREIVE